MCLWQCLNINFRLTVRGINFSPIFSPHLVTNPSSQTLKYKFRAKTILDVAICVIFCSILCFIFSVLRLHQLFLLLSREKSFTKLHLFMIPSFPNISQYDLTSATFNELKNITIPPYHRYCLCLKSKWIMLRATPG